MTTIVCNKTEMACDLQMTLSGALKYKAKTKIYKVDPHELHFEFEPFLVGFCGTASDIVDVVDFYYRPELYKGMPRTKGLSGLILTESGKIFTFDQPGKWLAIDGPYASVGSGSLTALGAMSMGATPKQAVQAAMKVDPYTGMGTKLYKF